MILEEAIAAMLVGIPLGILTGMIPGIHVNTLIAIILPLYFAIPFSNYFVAALFVSIMTTHVFVSFIPSILVGAPEPETALSVLPGHKLLLSGRGLEAIKLTVIGGLGSLMLGLILIFLLSGFFVNAYDKSRPFLHYILSIVVAYMVLNEKKLRKIFFALVVFVLSGLLGFFVLETTLLPRQYALFPALSGLFGLSTLIISLKRKGKIPEQKPEKIRIGKKDLLKSIVIGSLAGMVVGLLPGIGPAQATIISQQMFSLSGAERFLVAMSGINAADSVFSLSSLYLVGNPRSGVAVAVEKIFGQIGFYDFIFLLGIISCVAGVSAVITISLSRRMIEFMQKIDYPLLSRFVISTIFFAAYFLTGLAGVLVLFTSASIGVLAGSLGINKSHAMGVLLFPTILFFAGLTPLLSQLLGV